MLERIAIYNNKGGVGKSTSVINIAYHMHKAGKKVLVVDCDTQSNCFTFFMTERCMDAIPAVLPTEFEHLKSTTWKQYVEISDADLAVFDYILFDLPPAMDDTVKTIIRHTGLVYVPTMLGEFEVGGLKNITFEIARQNAQLGGIFITMYRKEYDSEVLEEFRSALQSDIMQTMIPDSRTVRESQKAGLPIEAYFIQKKVPHSQNSWKIVNAYEALSAEIMKSSNR